MADTRTHDLADLDKARRDATSIKEREHIDQVRRRVLNESAGVRRDREILANAFRGGDKEYVKRMTDKLHDQQE